MKRLFCTVILTLCMGCLSAQSNRLEVPTETHEDERFVLDSSFRQEINYEYHATDSIYLSRGFFRHANLSYPHAYDYTMLLDVDGLGVYPPGHGEQGGPNDGDTGVVGALGGTVDVGAMGGATYTIPIELPAGINGMQPSLALVYNSQGGNGLLGWKWELAGLSSITRTGKTRYHDGVVGGVTLNDITDRFMLDGQRLIQVQDYTDSIEFKTEQDNMAKIMAYVYSLEEARIVNNFKVWNSDGTILEYGFTADSRIDPQNGGNNALCWLLNKVSDRNGNSIVYNYTELQSSGEFYLESIQYTVNERLSVMPKFSVNFIYSNKSDYEFGYVAGNIVQQNRLLKTITVENDEKTELLKYTLEYFGGTQYAAHAYASDKMYHRLIEIKLEKNGKVLNPTKIKWEWDGSPTLHNNNAYMVDLDTTYLNNFVFVGDFNADGFSDILTVPYKGQNCHTYPTPVDMNILLNTGNGSFEYDSSLSMNNINGNPLATNLDWIHVVDINDDGYDDIVLQYYTQHPTTEDSYLMVYLNQEGSGFVPAWNNPLHQGIKFYLVLGDFFGEGKQSILVFTYARLNDPNLNIWPVLEPIYYIHYVNGTCISESVYTNPMTTNELVAGDFDGDGKTEILMVDRTEAKTYQLIRNGNNLLLVEEQHCYDIKYVPELNLFSGDYNGDGKDDLLCYGEKQNDPEKREWFFVFSTGTGFYRERTYIFDDYGFAPSEKMYTYSLEKVNSGGFAIFPSDFDGDGLCDIALSDGQEFFKVYSKFLYIILRIWNGYNHIYVYGIHPMACATVSDVNTRSQYLHAGNFYCKDNMSFLGNEGISKGRVIHRKPILCSVYSLHEYNSVSDIIDGLGNETRMWYQYTARVDTARTEIGAGIDRINSPMRALSAAAEYKVNNAPYTTFYNYEDATFHKDGHGYLGFLKQVATMKVADSFVGRRTSTYEIETMGSHAFSLPENEISEVYVGDDWRIAMRRDFSFRKVTCSRGQKIVKPAMTRQSSLFFNFDTANPDDLLRYETTEYDYSFGTGNTYQNAYNCTETRMGTNASSVGSYSQCEFKTEEGIEFYSDNYATWTLNRPHHKTVTQKRTGKPDVSRRWSYEFVAPDSYQIKRIYDNPMNISQNPLMTQTDFEYYEEGNVKTQTLKAPHGVSGEHTKTVKYEYGPGVGETCQHRLVTKSTTMGDDLSYETHYSYDAYDQVDSLTASNGLVTTYETNPLGVYHKSINPDRTQTCDALRWVEENDNNAPRNALYLKWSHTSGSQKTLTYYHKTGVELRTVSFGLNGETIYVDKTYDNRGRLEKVSNPYHPGETVQWTCYEYDNLDRLTKTITPDSTETVIAYNGLQTTTTITPIVGEPQTSSVTANAMGWTVRSDDASGNSYVTYDHFADGLLAEARVNNDATTAITATYDAARNRHTLTDPNYGTLTTTYNAYGELFRRVSPKELEEEKETVYHHDGMGRLVSEFNGMEDIYTRYVFDEEEGPTKGTLKQIRHHTYDYHNIQCLDYEYDELGRNTKTTETRPTGTYETLTAYDDFSRVSQTVFPTGVTVNYEYHKGFLQSIFDADHKLLWRTDSINALGQLTDATLGNGSSTHRAYNDGMHYIDSIVTTNNLQNLSYEYDKFGNLASRKDNLRNLEETFLYDKMNRLTDIYLGNTHSQIVYDPLGRMTGKQADGSTVFAAANFQAVAGQPARPHAMKGAQTIEGVFPTATQTIAYTAFDKVKAIVEDGNYILYTYGYDQQRIHLTESVGGAMRLKEYVGLCEFITDIDIDRDSFHSLTYLVGPFGVFAVVEKQGGEESVHYILKDHLGSWTTITDSEGIVEQELSYDAWGSLRNPTTWSGDFSGTPMFDRGFTGHEHMTAFGLINMNGRCYDPLTSSFLSVDAYVQDPTSAQSFNRYAYCGYNPLRYTDPTGWLSQYNTSLTKQNDGANQNPEAYWYSNDPNDMLWGRSVHPCETGNPYWTNSTATNYSQGNESVGGDGKPTTQVVTDAGHGMKENNKNLIDPGAVDGFNKESDFALLIEQSVAEWLTKFGVSVERTREGEMSIDGNTINYRWKLANELGAEVFVSIHLDYDAKENAYAVYEVRDSNLEWQQKNSIELAHYIMDNLTTINPANKSVIPSTNTNHGTIGVLRYFNGDAGVLLEMGGIASEANRNNIINNHSSIGREIATGVYQYLNNGTKPYIGPGYKCRYY